MTQPDPLDARAAQERREEHGERPPRKLHLDARVYCALTETQRGGDPDCDHDFNRSPTYTASEWARWDCTKCGRQFFYDVWD